MRTNPDYCVRKIRSKKFWSRILLSYRNFSRIPEVIP